MTPKQLLVPAVGGAILGMHEFNDILFACGSSGNSRRTMKSTVLLAVRGGTLFFGTRARGGNGILDVGGFGAYTGWFLLCD